MRKKVLTVTAIVSGIYVAALWVITSHAAGTEVVTQPLDNLVIAVIGAVGLIILAKNIMEFAQAYQNQDSSSMNSALKGIVAGTIMAMISPVLSFLGF